MVVYLFGKTSKGFMSARRLTIFLGLLAVVSVNFGCGKKVYNLVPAKGNITVDGKPVGDLMIQFMPDIDGTSKLPKGQPRTQFRTPKAILN